MKEGAEARSFAFTTDHGRHHVLIVVLAGYKILFLSFTPWAYGLGDLYGE